jgi:hypothetical protein
MSESDHPTQKLNLCLHRLPLILDILDEIEDDTTHTGDDHLRQGSHQAVRCMVERLRDIKPPQTCAKTRPPTGEVQIASTWLLGERPRKLLPSSLYDELSGLIHRLMPETAEMPNGHRE